MKPDFFSSWDDVRSFLKLAGVMLGLVLFVLFIIAVPIAMLNARENEVSRQACEQRGGRWLVTGNSDHDGDIHTCLDEGGHVR